MFVVTLRMVSLLILDGYRAGFMLYKAINLFSLLTTLKVNYISLVGVIGFYILLDL